MLRDYSACSLRFQFIKSPSVVVELEEELEDDAEGCL